MTELCKLGEKYGVDKCPSIYHSYTPEYDSLFSPIRDKVHKFVEIGIGNVPLMRRIVGETYKPGASLRMWRDYFPYCHVIGCDILPEVIFNDEERISTFIVDQSNEASLRKFSELIGKCDVILDDGSHIEAHMIISFKTLWESVVPGGVYIIEDIKRSSLTMFENLATKLGFVDAELVKSHPGKTNWDSFVVFKKK